MKTRMICSLACLLAMALPVVAWGGPPGQDAFSEDFMTNYYLEKDIGELPNFLKWVQSSKFLEQRPGLVGPASGFLAVILEDNPGQVGRLAKSVKFTGVAKRVVIRALWLSGNTDEIKKTFGEVPKQKHVGLKKGELGASLDLPTVWGAFLGSGDIAYVKKIIDFLEPTHNIEGDAEMQAKMRETAEESLYRNMFKHELVHRSIAKEAKSRTGEVRKKLKDMLTKVQKVTMAESDGDFTAELLLMDEVGMQEFAKPVDEVPRMSSMSTAKRGDVVGIKLVFAGIALKDDLNADVRYDLKILDPDGQIYDKSDVKDLEGLSRKVPTRFRIFDNLQVVAIKFEPKDKLGKYKILCALHDKVGKKSVKLEKEITLEK